MKNHNGKGSNKIVNKIKDNIRVQAGRLLKDQVCRSRAPVKEGRSCRVSSQKLDLWDLKELRSRAADIVSAARS